MFASQLVVPVTGNVSFQYVTDNSTYNCDKINDCFVVIKLIVTHVGIYNDACLVCLACAFYWSSLGDGTSGLVAGSRDSEEHA